MSITETDAARRRPPLEGQAKVTIEVDGESVEACAGESVAAALLASGHRIFRRTEKRNATRGLFCGMGICFDCLVQIDGEPGVRACMTPVRDGMVIETGAPSDD
jgi:predicted molibdopterin-dependent oxidoreductase YjgC